MKPRRRISAPPQCFFLNLGGVSSGEVQVQQKNEYEVSKFLIDGDDAILSPMVTLDPSHSYEQSTVCDSSFTADISATMPVEHWSDYNNANPVNNDVIGVPLNKGFGNTAAQSNVPNSTNNNISLGPAKFIHVNNTNLFVLIDGISMFFEGKSTFMGDEDPLLRQHILKKKSIKALSNSKSSVSMESITSIDVVGNGGGGRGGAGGRGGGGKGAMMMEKGAPTPPSYSADTVENAIRCIQQVGSKIHPAVQKPAPPTANSSFAEAAVPPTVSRQLRSFFAGARKPAGVPLFCRRPAAAGQQPIATATATAATAKIAPTTMTTTTMTMTAMGGKRGGGVDGAGPIPPASTALGDTGLKGKAHFLQPWGDVGSNAGSNASRSRGTPAFMRSNPPKPKPFSVDDVGHSNRSLDLDDVEVLHFIAGGSQGKVYCVRLDGKLYALKCIGVKEAMQATNVVERQGRKRGLVKELNMIRLQQSKPPSTHLMRMFNAVVSLNSRQQLSILMELMSFGVDKIQQMVARIPHGELMKMVQSTFKVYMAKNTQPKATLGRGLKEQHGPPSQFLGRRDFDLPKSWEMTIERQTPVQEILLSMIAADTLCGLKDLHTNYKIVHCDIKPENILLSFDKQSFKIADFGCGCVIDENTGKVRSSGVDLGAKLYRAPERLISKEFATGIAEAMPDEEEDSRVADSPFVHQVIEFDEKADVWSLGVTLLELACGVHPCSPFKSDFWNYTNELKLAKMVKPLTWSSDFCDFIVRCVSVDVAKRWSVDQLLQHPFISHYSNVPRSKLRIFMERLERESANFQRNRQRELLQNQILLSTNQVARDNYLKESRSKWKTFTGFLSVAPELKDLSKFPRLT